MGAVAFPAAAQSRTVFPDLSARLTAIRYAPAEATLGWGGWIGGGVGLVRISGATAYVDADLETVIGSERRAFDANQANYHLEVGARRPLGPVEATVFFHHVSRHAVDRPKPAAVDWNVLGVRVAGRFGGGAVRYEAGVGHTTLISLVDYRWELRGRLEGDLVSRPWGQVYAGVDARAVTTRPSTLFDRGGFVDLTAEAGVRWPRGSRHLDLFVAFDHRNDVFLETPSVRDRALLGLRIGYQGS
jgi:hypothetical protein